VSRRYDRAPIVRAFNHHAAARVVSEFEYIGPSPAGRFTVVVNGHREDLTAREAWLVAQALAAGRRIETTLAAKEEQC
jgi:hypothetical protein